MCTRSFSTPRVVFDAHVSPTRRAICPAALPAPTERARRARARARAWARAWARGRGRDPLP